MSSNLCQQSQAHRLYSLYLHYDASHAAKHEDPECKAVLQHCFTLLEKDYVVGTVPNHNGQLCPSYPSELAILEKPRHQREEEEQTGASEKSDMQETDQGKKQQQQDRSIVQDKDFASIPAAPTDLSSSSSSLHITPFATASSTTTATSTPIASSSTPFQTTQSHPPTSSIAPPHFIRQLGGSTNDNNSMGGLLISDNHNDSNNIHDKDNNNDCSIIDEGDQSFDLGESGMMSFQDIKTELDLIHPPPSLKQQQPSSLAATKLVKEADRSSRRHILPFPFRIPRVEKPSNFAIKEYIVPGDAAADSNGSSSNTKDDRSNNNKKTQENDPTIVDKDKVNDTQELSKQFEKSHFARVRARFVIPCILVRGKNICRSATLSNEVEVFMHSVNQKFNELNQKRKMFLYGTGEKSPDKEDRESSLERQRLEDIELLHRLGVTYINDLMVENRKVKYGLKVTSSEKVDSFGRYSKFKLVATPYPGVEFFQKFKANKYSARKLCFDWSQNFADAELQLPPGHTDNLGIRWRDYKGWDLIELTQNYIRLYLSHIADDTPDQRLANGLPDLARSQKGLLIHCISGWDRTPLFISLLRISLWADGEAHQSLSAAEILYLTMGYDWFLFNHLLADRSQRGEDIFYFCFYFLKFIYGDEFSLQSVSDLKKKNEKGTPRSNTTQQQRPSTVSPSPLSRDLGRLRDSEFNGSAGSLANAENQESICDECRSLKKSPPVPVGRDMAPRRGSAQDAASSTDGKPSSWQMVSFSTPPRHASSPRAPFVPTLQTISGKPQGSPLSGSNRRPSQAIGFVESKRSTELDSIVDRNAVAVTGTSPFLASEGGRPQLNASIFNARRSSSSSIPELFSEESKRHAAATRATASSALHGSPHTRTNFETSRLATSPNLFTASGHQDNTEGESSVGSQGANSLLDRQHAPRKRASTFDGGLLLSNEHDSRVDTDDEDDDDEDSKDLDEDLSSEDDDLEGNYGTKVSSKASQPSSNTPETTSVPSSSLPRPRICQVCHHSFVSVHDSGTVNVSSQPDRMVHSETLGQSPHSVLHGHHSRRLDQPRRTLGPLDGMRDEGLVYGGQDLDYISHPEFQQRTSSGRTYERECDREEGMFQLEIEDPRKNPLDLEDDCSFDHQPNIRHSDYYGGRNSTCSESPKCRNVDRDSGEGSALGSSPSTKRDSSSLLADRVSTPVHQSHDGSIECDENESFWDETSTVDYGYSPGSILNGFGLGLTKYSAEREDDLALELDGSLDVGGQSQDHDDHDDDEEEDEDDDAEDDDEDEDDEDGLGSRRGGLKSTHHERDHLFMPSLQGVFSNTGRHAKRGASGSSGSGAANLLNRKDPSSKSSLSSSPNNVHQDKAGGVFLQFPEGHSQSSVSSSLPPRPPSPPKKLTRRQKLRQLRRLFMDIRGEIGDGTRPPSVTMLDSKNLLSNNATKGSVTIGGGIAGGLSLGSSTDPLDDGGRSLKAESFSDDPSFQYRSPIATAAAFANRLQHGSASESGAGYTTAKDSTIGSDPEALSSQVPFFSRNRVGSGGPLRSNGIISPVAKRTSKQQQSYQSAQGSNGLGVQISSGRKSPFEWAAAAASSAAGIVTGGFGGGHGHGNNSYNTNINSSNDTLINSMSSTISPMNTLGASSCRQDYYRSGPSGSSHYSRQFTMPSAHIPAPQGQPQLQQHRQSSGGSSGSFFHSPYKSGTTTPPSPSPSQAYPYEGSNNHSPLPLSGARRSPSLTFVGSKFETAQGTTRRQSLTTAGSAAMNANHPHTRNSYYNHNNTDGSSSGGGGGATTNSSASIMSISSPSRVRGGFGGSGGSQHSGTANSSTALSGGAPTVSNIKEKSGENTGRWDWMPGIFA